INGPEEIDLTARIVFGEARGECIEEQLALAYSIANRVNHTGYPDTIEGVIGKMYKKGRVHEYNTLDNHNHNSSFEEARMQHTAAYNLTIGVSVAAICQCKPDPTNGATDFCVPDPSKGSCSATEDNKYYHSVNNIRIGQHMFASRAQVDSVQLIGK
ncbi:SLEB-like protein, partial [Mya arenaria]